MIRIKTKVGNDHIMTLWFSGKWVTIYTLDGRRQSIDSPNLFEAGQAHLHMCQLIKNAQGKKHENEDSVKP